MKTVLFSILLAFGVSAVAAIPPKVTSKSQAPIPILRKSGSLRGGQAGSLFSILDLKTEIAKNNRLERVKVSLGNGNFQAQNGSPGYFNVENRPELKRVQIDFIQTLNSKIQEKQLQAIFAKSPFVKSSQLVFEPEGQTLSLILNLKKAVDVRVIPVKGTDKKTAQLLVDLFEDSYIRRPAAAHAVRPAAKTIKK